MNRLSIKTRDPADQELIDSEVARLLEKGWSESDVRYYMYSLEEVNPTITEEFGLRRIRFIRQKYGEDS